MKKVILSAILLSVSASCTTVSRRVDGTLLAPRQPSYAVQTDAAGRRMLYPFRLGVLDRGRGIETRQSEWREANPQFAQAVVTCSTMKETNETTGAVTCSVVCSDLTRYPMRCDADIFGGGFDITGTVSN